MSSEPQRLSLAFTPEPGANVELIAERLRRVARDLPIEGVELGPVPTPAKPPARKQLDVLAYEGPICRQCGCPEFKVRKRQYVACRQCGKHYAIYNLASSTEWKSKLGISQ